MARMAPMVAPMARCRSHICIIIDQPENLSSDPNLSWTYTYMLKKKKNGSRLETIQHFVSVNR